jgi:hypothetical protein
MRKYYYIDGVDRKGPVTLAELRSVSGFNAETLVWYEDLPSWTRAGELEELSGVFIPVPPPLPKVAPAPPAEHAVVGDSVPKSSLRDKVIASAGRFGSVIANIKRPYLLVGIASVSVLLLSGLIYYFVFSEQLYSGGKGTEKKPYLISSLADMESLSANVKTGHTYKDTCFLLNRDLTGAGDTVTTIIGSGDHTFLGIFDGGAHSIAADVRINVSAIDYPFGGLFGSTEGAVIKNLNVIGGAVGTAKKPYLISSRADMEVLAAKVDAGHRYKDTCFLLTRDLTGAADTVITIVGTAESRYFGGLFDGGGHCIAADINVSGKKYPLVGIFGSVKDATIKNLSVSGRIVSEVSFGNETFVGGICGFSKSGNTVSNCHNSASISARGDKAFVGGIMGGGDGNIIKCHNSGEIISRVHKDNRSSAVSGGIAGGFYNGDINYCDNSGEIIARGADGNDGSAGGITGSGRYSKISCCYNSGKIAAVGKLLSHAGGITGAQFYGGTISNCYSTGEISAKAANTRIGGIAGLIDGGVLSSCYNTGEVITDAKAYGLIGGIVGGNGGTVKSCFAANANILGYTGKIIYGRIVGTNSFIDGGRTENCYAGAAMKFNRSYISGVSRYANLNGEDAVSSTLQDQEWIEGRLHWDFSIWLSVDEDYPVLRSEVAH